MAVREGLLVILSDGPSHGYQLKVAFEEATGGVWPLNVGQVYTTLDRLGRDGLVEVQSDDDGQKTYGITGDGIDELGAWWAATTTDAPPPRDELILKVLMAVSRGSEQALEVIARQRDALLTLLQQRRRASEPLSRRSTPSLAKTLMNDALMVRAEADLRWLDLCEERIAADR